MITERMAIAEAAMKALGRALDAAIIYITNLFTITKELILA